MQALHAKRKFRSEEKQQLLANLDFEVEHKIRQLESLLSDALSEFRGRHELQISRIPHIVRGISMAEFHDKYHNDITTASRGLQEQKLGGTEGAAGTIDRAAMKRKWFAVQDDGEGSEKGMGKDDGGNMNKATKNPRTMANVTTPQKKPPFAVGKNPRTPGTGRINPRAPSPSPRKFQTTTTIPHSHSRPPSRATSPTKPRAHRPPSSATFNPTIPKTPAYPGASTQAPRVPRKDEFMMSVNGSPLTNPFDLGLSWLAETPGKDGDRDDYSDGDVASNRSGRGGESETSKGGNGKRAERIRTNSIIVRRDDTSFNSSVASSSNHPPPSHPHHSGHTRSNTHTHISQSTSTRPPSSLATHSQPHPRSHSAMAGPVRTTGLSARVAVPTKDGHTLEFDPLQTSPSALDMLEGITDSAKKQAKEDMVKLVQTAVARWNIT